MIKECALTTIDNPFNPFDDFNSWFLYDIEKGYDTILETSDSGYVMLQCLVNGKIQSIELTDLENDLIDAFLYKKPISPKFGVKKLDTKDYGVHTDYVKKYYPDKDI